MTNQEAIEKFEKIKKGNIYLIHQRIEGKEVFDDYSLCDMAISALKKQVPKKPKRAGYFLVCPICYERNGSFDFDYVVARQRGHDENISHCLVCGQAIDWTDNE